MGPSNRRGMALSLTLRALVLSLALVGWMAAPALAAPAVAAPQQMSSDPEAGEELQSAPSRVTVTFSEPLQAGSNLEVTDECNKPVAHGDATIGGIARNELSIAIHYKPKGTYTVDYLAMGVTGTTADSFTFTVTSGRSCGDDGKHPNHGGGGDDGKHPNHDDDDGKRPEHDKGHMPDQVDGNHGNNGDHSGGSRSEGSHGSAGRHQSMGKGDRHPRGHDKDGKHGGRHGGGHRSPGSGGDNDNQLVAAGEDLIPTDIPTGTTVMISLGLAILLGAVGGWVLRVSTPS